MANGTIAFDTLQTSGQITGTAKSLDTDYVVNGSAKVLGQKNTAGTSIDATLNVSSLDDDGTGEINMAEFVRFMAHMKTAASFGEEDLIKEVEKSASLLGSSPILKLLKHTCQ